MPRAKQLPDVFIVTPTYNKRENLPLFVKRVGKSLKGVKYGLIIVDDNSTAETKLITCE